MHGVGHDLEGEVVREIELDSACLYVVVVVLLLLVVLFQKLLDRRHARVRGVDLL
jgi:hypothetical protein